MDYTRWHCEINVFMRWKVNIVKLMTKGVGFVVLSFLRREEKNVQFCH